MCFVHKVIKRTSKSEQGFVLIVAIMAIAILMAIGFFALTMISGDLKITARLVGERKAFSAAESGVHAILSSNATLAAGNIAETQVDPTGDPLTTYSATTVQTNYYAVGKGEAVGTGAPVFNTIVTGRDSDYSSEAQIAIGVAGQSVDITTKQEGQ